MNTAKNVYEYVEEDIRKLFQEPEQCPHLGSYRRQNGSLEFTHPQAPSRRLRVRVHDVATVVGNNLSQIAMDHYNEATACKIMLLRKGIIDKTRERVIEVTGKYNTDHDYKNKTRQVDGGLDLIESMSQFGFQYGKLHKFTLTVNSTNADEPIPADIEEHYPDSQLLCSYDTNETILVEFPHPQNDQVKVKITTFDGTPRDPITILKRNGSANRGLQPVSRLGGIIWYASAAPKKTSVQQFSLPLTLNSSSIKAHVVDPYLR